MSHPDAKLASDVVDQFKKQGVFDQFRKECLADVDTTPSYQNLTFRVQNMAEIFLKNHRWRSDINKNQLRESLRRNLTDSLMLSKSVDMVVDQIISAEIINNFKPEIDKIICEKLGLDYNEWLAKQSERKVKRVHTRGGAVPSLFDFQMPTMLNLRMGENHGIAPPHGDLRMPNGSGFIPPTGPPPAMHGPPPPNLLPPMHIPPPHLGELPPPMNALNHPMNMGGGGLGNMGGGYKETGFGYGMPPHMQQQQYEYDAQDTGNYFPPQYPNNAPGFPGTMTSFPPMGLPGLGGYSAGGLYPAALLGMEASMLPPYATANDVNNEIRCEEVETEVKKPNKKNKKKKEKESSQTVVSSSLVDVPLPQTDPPITSADTRDVSTVDALLTENTSNMDVESPSTQLNKNDNNNEEVAASPMDLDGGQSQTGESVDNVTAASFHDDSSSIPVGELTRENVAAKEYHFAWDSVQVDDLSISSVHTSDLSGFDDSDEDEGKGEERKNKVSGGEEERERVVEEGSVDNDALDDGDASRLELNNSDTATQSTVFEEVVKTAAERSSDQPKRLISLKYNMSDSEDEETREQRKARMADEKELRCLRRQQRRAELECKRKEKDDSKNKIKKEKDDSKIKKETDSNPTNCIANPSESTVPVGASLTAIKCDDRVFKTESPAGTLESANPPGDEEVLETLPAAEDISLALEIEKKSETLSALESEIGRKNEIVAEAENRVLDEIAADYQVAEQSYVLGGNGNEAEAEDKNDADYSPQRSSSKRHRHGYTKQQLKEELREKKVMEKQRELRRRRTVNPKYTSSDFTSMFTDRKADDADETNDGAEQEEEEVCEEYAEEEVVVDQSVEIDESGNFVDYSEGLQLDDTSSQNLSMDHHHSTGVESVPTTVLPAAVFPVAADTVSISSGSDSECYVDEDEGTPSKAATHGGSHGYRRRRRRESSEEESDASSFRSHDVTLSKRVGGDGHSKRRRGTSGEERSVSTGRETSTGRSSGSKRRSPERRHRRKSKRRHVSKSRGEHMSQSPGGSMSRGGHRREHATDADRSHGASSHHSGSRSRNEGHSSSSRAVSVSKDPDFIAVSQRSRRSDISHKDVDDQMDLVDEGQSPSREAEKKSAERDSDEESQRPRMPITAINFGEAEMRASQRLVEPTEPTRRPIGWQRPDDMNLHQSRYEPGYRPPPGPGPRDIPPPWPGQGHCDGPSPWPPRDPRDIPPPWMEPGPRDLPHPWAGRGPSSGGPPWRPDYVPPPPLPHHNNQPWPDCRPPPGLRGPWPDHGREWPERDVHEYREPARNSRLPPPPKPLPHGAGAMPPQFPGIPSRGPNYRGDVHEYKGMDQGGREHGNFHPSELGEEQRNFRFAQLRDEQYGAAERERDSSYPRRGRHTTPEPGQGYREDHQQSPSQSRIGRRTTPELHATSSSMQKRGTSGRSGSSEDRSTSSPSSGRMISKRKHPMMGDDASSRSPLVSGERATARSSTPSAAEHYTLGTSSPHSSASSQDHRMRHHPSDQRSTRSLRTFLPGTGVPAPFHANAESGGRYTSQRKSTDSQTRGSDEAGDALPAERSDSLSRTRASQRRTEEESAPIAKRLRR